MGNCEWGKKDDGHQGEWHTGSRREKCIVFDGMENKKNKYRKIDNSSHKRNSECIISIESVRACPPADDGSTVDGKNTLVRDSQRKWHMLHFDCRPIDFHHRSRAQGILHAFICRIDWKYRQRFSTLSVLPKIINVTHTIYNANVCERQLRTASARFYINFVLNE